MEEREDGTATDGTLDRQRISDSVTGLGWRYVLATLRTCVRVGAMAEAAKVAARVVAVCGDDADGHLHVDLRPGHLVLSVQSLDSASVTPRDLELAERIAMDLREQGLEAAASLGAGFSRSVQVVEIAIDALDIAAIRPFWKAILGYADEPGKAGPEDPLVDPLGQSPAIWFQRMGEPRAQRNRIHLDVSVPHDEASQRMDAALAAGGTLVYDAEAPAFWVLADAEGNEACVTTWQGRD